MPQAPLNDSLPPYNEEAEAATLGALLLSFSVDLLDEVIQHVKPDDFFKGAHQLIFNSILRLHDRGEGVDILTLTDELTNTGDIDKAGGAAYAASLTSRVPTTANVAWYAKIVKETSLRRSLLNAARTIIARAHDESQDIRSIIDNAEKIIFDITDNQNRGQLKPVREVLPKAVGIIEEREKNPQHLTGIASGFQGLDNLTGGFQKSEMIIIGARPSIGKTALALSMASNIAIKNKIPCGFFTLEMSDISLMMRIISTESKINSNRFRLGMVGNKNFKKVFDAAGRIYEAPLIFQDSPNIPLLDLKSLARKMVIKHDVQIIFIDYIGLITPEDSTLPRYEQVSAISRSLKALARELDIPVVALAQLGRQSETKQPTLADIRESGALEQDADVVLFLHRDRNSEKKGDDNDDRDIHKTQLIIAKQRNGPIGIMNLMFVPEYAHFDNYENL